MYIKSQMTLNSEDTWSLIVYKTLRRGENFVLNFENHVDLATRTHVMMTISGYRSDLLKNGEPVDAKNKAWGLFPRVKL